MVVTDLQGKVRMLCDTDIVTVLEDMDRSKIQLLPPDLTKLLENHFRRVAALYGIASMNAKDRVKFTSVLFLLRKILCYGGLGLGQLEDFRIPKSES